MCCYAGTERSIAATKSLTSQMMCVTLLAIKFAQFKNLDVADYINDLVSVPQFIDKTYELRGKIKSLARFVSKFKNVIICADGISYALAKEAALKIK